MTGIWKGRLTPALGNQRISCLLPLFLRVFPDIACFSSWQRRTSERLANDRSRPAKLFLCQTSSRTAISPEKPCLYEPIRTCKPHHFPPATINRKIEYSCPKANYTLSFLINLRAFRHEPHASMACILAETLHTQSAKSLMWIYM